MALLAGHACTALWQPTADTRVPFGVSSVICPPPVFASRPGAPRAAALSPARGWPGWGAELCAERAERDEPALAPTAAGEGSQHRPGRPAPSPRRRFGGSPPGGAAPRGSGPARPPVRCRGAYGCPDSVACGPGPVGTGAANNCWTWALAGRWQSSGRCQAALNWHLGLPFCEYGSSFLCFFTPSFLFLISA